MHVLFVCNGNVCRSAIAERLTRAIAIDYRLPVLTAESAGTRALIGFPIEPLAAQTLRRLGGDPEEFRARRLAATQVDRADLVPAMTEQIRDRIAELLVPLIRALAPHEQPVERPGLVVGPSAHAQRLPRVVAAQRVG